MTRPLRPTLSLHLLNFAPEGHDGDWDHLFRLARAADAAGIDRVNVFDHVAFGEALDDYSRPEKGGRVDGRQPTGPDGHWPDPLVILSMVAAQTSRVRLGTQILQAALRRPATLAKTTATIDALSKGRLDLGVGVGWQAAEYQAAGLAFERRGTLLNHTLEVCQTLWAEQRASYASPELAFDNIHQMPKPVQLGGIPLWIAGTIRDTTVHRLLRFGMRWIAWGKDEDMAVSLPMMKDAIEKAGGDPAALKASAPLPAVRTTDGKIDIARTMEALSPRLAAGQTDFSFVFLEEGDERFQTERLSEIVKAFREATSRAIV